MNTWSMLSLQNSASPMMEHLIFFHDNTLLMITIITIFVLYMMISIMTNKYINLTLLENQNIEMIWTIIPAIFLVFIALPSLQILYMIDESNSPSITIKIMGHQWYWSYEYSDFNSVKFDSFMNKNNTIDSFRLLDVDNRIVLPMKTQIRSIISSSDVIHAWTIPALGIKSDAVPGRLNQMSFMINRPGIFFGQCSEICGMNHSFMPISLESINMNFFIKWINNF
uniref:Cytochrome c oxidase subunit 2 n=1 Tax=Stenopsyche tienmushanensis TaxID=1560151 RepID=A0A8A0Y0I7_9NEOP|nr:cytochrome c oxidase subunit II [Stenopsyche tienmushanensis]QSQ87269.1 cytochrome c oxidase subunit II [Stenopsyche tienmushanensis]UDU84906.1 cytochrome c oxidase subunit 2 [Stenopsyche tienmushanensis]